MRRPSSRSHRASRWARSKRPRCASRSRVTERLIKIAKDILEKVKLQKELGQLTGLDVAGQEALVAQTEATLPPLRKALDQNRDALTALSGHLPGEGLAGALRVREPETAAQLAGEPALRHRLAAAGRARGGRQHACGERHDRAWPSPTGCRSSRSTATSAAAARSSKTCSAANPAFYFYTGLANASQTIFDGFTLQQRQRAAEAGFDQAAAQYRLAVLTAFPERRRRALRHPARYRWPGEGDPRRGRRKENAGPHARATGRRAGCASAGSDGADRLSAGLAGCHSGAGKPV